MVVVVVVVVVVAVAVAVVVVVVVVVVVKAGPQRQIRRGGHVVKRDAHNRRHQPTPRQWVIVRTRAPKRSCLGSKEGRKPRKRRPLVTGRRDARRHIHHIIRGVAHGVG